MPKAWLLARIRSTASCRYAKRAHAVAFWLVAGVGFALFVWMLRHSAYTADPLLSGYFEISSCLIALVIAALWLVRFRGTRDRICLILAFGFLVSGLIEASARLASHPSLIATAEAQHVVPHAWMVSRTLLAMLMVAALAAGRRVPPAPDPADEILIAVLIVGAVAYVTSAAYFAVPAKVPIFRGAIVPRPWDLLPAAIYLAAALWYWRKRASTPWASDRAVCMAAGLNVACHLAITQSQRLLDGPFAFAQFLKGASYAVVLGGALVDNARLFKQVQHLATSDPLTGLANYRRLSDVFDAEMQRSDRTGRSFAVLLLDLDGLKSINDHFGHLRGNQALCRLADILRAHCRSIDTAARYGGDEFVLLLLESGEKVARRVAARICNRLAHDGHQPPLSVSVGIAVHPRDGATIDELLRVADHDLYKRKADRVKELSERRSLPGG